MNLGGICVFLTFLALGFLTWPHGAIFFVIVWLVWRSSR